MTSSHTTLYLQVRNQISKGDII